MAERDQKQNNAWLGFSCCNFISLRTKPSVLSLSDRGEWRAGERRSPSQMMEQPKMKARSAPDGEELVRQEHCVFSRMENLCQEFCPSENEGCLVKTQSVGPKVTGVTGILSMGANLCLAVVGNRQDHTPGTVSHLQLCHKCSSLRAQSAVGFPYGKQSLLVMKRCKTPIF